MRGAHSKANRQTNRQTNRDRQTQTDSDIDTDKQTDRRQEVKQRDSYTDRQRFRRADLEACRQIGRQTDRQADRQAGSHGGCESWRAEESNFPNLGTSFAEGNLISAVAMETKPSQTWTRRLPSKETLTPRPIRFELHMASVFGSSALATDHNLFNSKPLSCL